MIDRFVGRFGALVTSHPAAVVLLVLLLTGGVAAGLPQLDMADQTGIDDDVFTQTDVGEGLEYSNSRYGEGDDSTAVVSVYVRPEDGNALSREQLLGTLAYQESVLDNSTVQAEMADDVRGPPTLVGKELAGEDATVSEQRAAIRNADEAELERAIQTSLADSAVLGMFLPRSYSPGSTTAESMRIQFTFEKADVTAQQEPLPDDDAERVLYDEGDNDPAFFTMGTIAEDQWETAQLYDILWLIIPPALALVIVVLAFAYRDIVDIVLGFVGVLLSVVWFFGILGWLGIPAGFASIVGPVLIVALSIDFGLHVFMRYREERSADEEVRPPMKRSITALTTTFLVVAVTAGVGFLANVTSPIEFIRAFGVVITLGVFSSVFLFLTLVPALKVWIETTLERYGVDRRKPALGTTGWLKRRLSVGVSLARRGAPLLVALAVLGGAFGMVAAAEIDRQGFEEDFVDDENWQTQLPEPFGWTAHETEYKQNLDYVQDSYQSTDSRERSTILLIRGDINDSTALWRVHEGTHRAEDSDMIVTRDGEVRAISPLSVMTALAPQNEELAATIAEVADENDEFGELVETLAREDQAFATALEEAEPRSAGVDSDGNVTEVYDVMYRTAPDEAATVLERDDGEYRSMRLILPVEQRLDVNERDEEMHAIADDVRGDTDLDVVPIGFATVANAGLEAVAESVLLTMVVALVAVATILAIIFRIERSSATLGVVTVVPVALVLGFVFGAMYLFDVALTFITAFLVSITLGLGIDYSIHVSDRFVQELDRGAEPVDALSTTVTGTGGALLGSALTSAGAFATLVLHPSPLFQSFGVIIVFALVGAFTASVLVFPSLLLWWGRRLSPSPA